MSWLIESFYVYIDQFWFYFNWYIFWIMIVYLVMIVKFILISKYNNIKDYFLKFIDSLFIFCNLII